MLVSQHHAGGQMLVGGITRYLEARIVASCPNEALDIIREITKRKLAENALKESGKRYALVASYHLASLFTWRKKMASSYRAANGY